jgi:hypothetical protein
VIGANARTGGGVRCMHRVCTELRLLSAAKWEINREILANTIDLQEQIESNKHLKKRQTDNTRPNTLLTT